MVGLRRHQGTDAADEVVRSWLVVETGKRPRWNRCCRGRGHLMWRASRSAFSFLFGVLSRRERKTGFRLARAAKTGCSSVSASVCRIPKIKSLIKAVDRCNSPTDYLQLFPYVFPFPLLFLQPSRKATTSTP
jgi:hypothetical protein